MNVSTEFNIKEFRKQGWRFVDWVDTIPEVEDYIYELTPDCANQYSFKITEIGEKTFIAISMVGGYMNNERTFNKYDRVYIFKKKGSGHCLLGGIGVENEKH